MLSGGYCLAQDSTERVVDSTQAKKLEKPIQFTGVTADGESNYPIPFASVMVKSRFAGTISDSRGFFSFVALAGDTIQFSAVGFKTTYAKVPTDIDGFDFSIIQLMERDTITLDVVDVYPWPSKKAFREAFVSLELPMDEYDIAAKNLQSSMIRDLAIKMGMDASANQEVMIQREIDRLYYAANQKGILNVGTGSVPIPSSVLSPGAWAEFFKALKRGDFRQR